MSSINPGAVVCSTGRTSGHQRGQVCEVPAYVHGAKTGNGTGKATREWFVEEPDPCDDEDAWIRGGIGVQGDSGAAIIDCETNAIIGQVWGRNKYFGPGPRQTFFTPILDIMDDIQERCGEQARPQLPQYGDEADRWPAYPVCRQCFDLHEYLDSRRSSRESCVSLIGLHDGPGREHEQDILSVSELATPKDSAKTPRDTSYLIRHVGPEESTSSLGNMLSPTSFGSVVSPAPVHSFMTYVPAGSPGGADLRSPYAQSLDENDLYDPTYTTRNEVALGKRPAASVPMVRIGSQQSGKRPRLQ